MVIRCVHSYDLYAFVIKLAWRMEGSAQNVCVKVLLGITLEKDLIACLALVLV